MWILISGIVSLVLIGGLGSDSPELTGVVLDAAGGPVAAAEVLLVPGLATEEPRIEAGTRTDSEGRFRLPLRLDASGRALWPPRVVWARGPDDAVAWRTLHPARPPAEPVRLILRPIASTRWIVRGPDGEAVENAQVAPRALGSRSHRLPEVLSQSLLKVTDETGTFWLERIAPEAWTGFTITSARFGQQWRERDPREQVGSTTLLPTGRVRGRLLAEEASTVARRRVRCETTADGGAAGGWLEVVTDDEGQFIVDALAAGELTIEVQPTSEQPSGVRAQPFGLLAEGETRDLNVPLRSTVRLSGQVLDGASRRPVAHARLMLEADPVEAISDAEGRWQLETLPGRIALGVQPPSRAFLDLGVNTRRVIEVTEDPEQVIEPLVLDRGRIISGQVVDPRGDPVADAWVTAIWEVTTPEGNEFPRAAAVRTDARGGFVVSGLSGGQSIRLRTMHRAAESAEPLTWRVGAAGRPILIASPTLRYGLTGLARRADGQAVIRASVEVWTRPVDSVDDHRAYRFADVSTDETSATDAWGRFAWARWLSADRDYRIVITPPGEAPFVSGWIAGTDLATPQELELPANASVRGRVVDASGQPVAGVTLTQAGDGPRPQHARSGEQGEFELGGFRSDSGFVFAEGKTFTFGLAEGGRVQLVLPKSQAPRASSALDLSLARELVPRLLEPIWESSLAAPHEPFHLRTFELMARVAPERVLELIEGEALPGPQQRDFLRIALARHWLAERPDEAHRLLAAVELPLWKTAGYVAAAKALPIDAKDARKDLLTQAEALLPGVDDPSFRLLRTGVIAQEWWQIGEHEHSRELMNEGQRQAKLLAPGDFTTYARGAFASHLARTDLEAALGLLGERGRQADAHLGGMAVAIAADHLGDAERIFRALSSDGQRSRWIGEICRAMAPTDLVRTRRLIEGLGDLGQRASALAVCADAVRPFSSARAASLINEAFEELERVPSMSGQIARVPAAAIGFSILPVVESISPERLPELMRRSLALRRPQPWPELLGGEVARLEEEVSLALFAARFDRDLARALLKAAVERAGLWQDEPGLARRILEARTIIDPHWALESLEQSSKDGDDLAARQAVAEILTAPEDDRWNDLRRRHLGLYW